MTKDCKHCKRTGLPLTQFYKKQSGKYGRGTMCKECMREYQQERGYYKKPRKPRGRALGDKRLVPGYTRVKPPIGKSGCSACAHDATCKQRVGVGTWILCERPDYADLRRVNGGIPEPELLTERIKYARLPV